MATSFMSSILAQITYLQIWMICRKLRSTRCLRMSTINAKIPLESSNKRCFKRIQITLIIQNSLQITKKKKPTPFKLGQDASQRTPSRERGRLDMSAKFKALAMAIGLAFILMILLGTVMVLAMGRSILLARRTMVSSSVQRTSKSATFPRMTTSIWSKI